MNPSVAHQSFSIERVYPASPSRVFSAWSDPVAKRRWFACHDEWTVETFDLDFRIGGLERLATRAPGGEVHAFDGRYFDIVVDRRIIYAYAMSVGDVRGSVSLATVELVPEGSKTRMIFTEQAAFLDGNDGGTDREKGTRVWMEALGVDVERFA